jgi:urea transporter
MSKKNTAQPAAAPPSASGIPQPVLVILRGIGQVFFQENALTGALFLLGIAVSSPVMALGALVGAAIGTVTAWQLKFDKAETTAGIYGFNSTLVGIATTVLTRLMRGQVPFPTYTTPFIVTTWVIFFVGRALGAAGSDPGAALLVPNLPVHPFIEATAHGIGQVMFQGSVWTGILFLAGIFISDRKHATWVLLGAVLGMLVASYHLAAGARGLDPERLIDRAQFENIALGLYGYNATLAAVALSLWRKSLIPPVLGIILSVPLTEFVPLLGLPALTAPFVLATWLVMCIGWLEGKFHNGAAAA